MAVSIVELGESSAYVVPEGTEPRVAIENGSGALVAAYGERGRTVGLALVPPQVPAEVTSIAITVDTTALALVGLTAGLVSVDAREMAAIWAVASATPEYEELTDEIESAMRLNFDLAAAAAGRGRSSGRNRRRDAGGPGRRDATGRARRV